MRIADIPKSERPRERLFSYGVSSLSTAELLALILGQGTRDMNVIDLSNSLLSEFGFDCFASCSLSELKTIKGVGPAKASQILALVEFTKRFTSSKMRGVRFLGGNDVFNYLAPKVRDLDKEHFFVLLLDSKNRLIKDSAVSVGILNSVLVHPREVFKLAVKESANSIIVAHNHPSGDPAPSHEDVVVTKQLQEAGKTLNIPLLDHVIIGKEEYWSWNENE
ncbi:hypothetical protein COT72_03150 [archaeon CG10_big_fil_rev_8_21_14_0_10_43_11]|nr:MAG: hypothetical protein COT72_03150 [archaeon CG10_big_fil_rev_8_21_14_0_10_43_11]